MCSSGNSLDDGYFPDLVYLKFLYRLYKYHLFSLSFNLKLKLVADGLGCLISILNKVKDITSSDNNFSPLFYVQFYLSQFPDLLLTNNAENTVCICAITIENPPSPVFPLLNI